VKNLAAPAAVTIGGVDAKVLSATTAPESIAGVFQIKVQVPPTAPAGLVPTMVKIGSASSRLLTNLSVR